MRKFLSFCAVAVDAALAVAAAVAVARKPNVTQVFFLAHGLGQFVQRR